MAGHFTETDPEQCRHYALFLARLSRKQADVIFWGNFCLTIALLIIASQMYTRASLNPNHRHIRIQCLLISLFCFCFALPAVAFSALAGLQIEFCDGEDLMHFYWSFWTLIQVGSLIAILGVSVNQLYGIWGKREPPWNVALGTPVLVIAALGHAGQTGGKAIWKRISKQSLRIDAEHVDEGEGSGRRSFQGGIGIGNESDLEIDLEAHKEKGEEGEGGEHREERMDKNVSRHSSRSSTIINASDPSSPRLQPTKNNFRTPFPTPMVYNARHPSYGFSAAGGGDAPSDNRSASQSPRSTSPSTISDKGLAIGDKQIKFARPEDGRDGDEGHKSGDATPARKSASIYRHHRDSDS